MNDVLYSKVRINFFFICSSQIGHSYPVILCENTESVASEESVVL